MIQVRASFNKFNLKIIGGTVNKYDTVDQIIQLSSWKVASKVTLLSKHTRDENTVLGRGIAGSKPPGFYFYFILFF